ncbi:unnamed protein product [Closterium sp. NIES-65]|nr:unnamed protein product [Closterium sp. NIES-65]
MGVTQARRVWGGLQPSSPHVRVFHASALAAVVTGGATGGDTGKAGVGGLQPSSPHVRVFHASAPAAVVTGTTGDTGKAGVRGLQPALEGSSEHAGEAGRSKLVEAFQIQAASDPMRGFMVALRKSELGFETGLALRDLRVVISALQNQIPTILIRPRAIVVSLAHVRAVITANRAYVLNTSSSPLSSLSFPVLSPHFQPLPVTGLLIPHIPPLQIPTILIRPRAIVVSLAHVRAVITANRAYVLNTSSPRVRQRLIPTLLRRLSASRSAAAAAAAGAGSGGGGAGCDVCSPPSPSSPASFSGSDTFFSGAVTVFSDCGGEPQGSEVRGLEEGRDKRGVELRELEREEQLQERQQRQEGQQKVLGQEYGEVQGQGQGEGQGQGREQWGSDVWGGEESRCRESGREVTGVCGRGEDDYEARGHGERREGIFLEEEREERRGGAKRDDGTDGGRTDEREEEWCQGWQEEVSERRREEWRARRQREEERRRNKRWLEDLEKESKGRFSEASNGEEEEGEGGREHGDGHLIGSDGQWERYGEVLLLELTQKDGVLLKPGQAGQLGQPGQLGQSEQPSLMSQGEVLVREGEAKTRQRGGEKGEEGSRVDGGSGGWVRRETREQEKAKGGEERRWVEHLEGRGRTGGVEGVRGGVVGGSGGEASGRGAGEKALLDEVGVTLKVKYASIFPGVYQGLRAFAGGRVPYERAMAEQEAFLRAKNELLRLERSANQICNAVREVLSNDEDMAEMYLSRKSSLPHGTANSAEHSEVEELLEDHLRRMEEVVGEAEQLLSMSDATSEYLRTALDSARNQLIELDVLVNMATCSLAVGGSIAAVFGKHLVIDSTAIAPSRIGCPQKPSSAAGKCSSVSRQRRRVGGRGVVAASPPTEEVEVRTEPLTKEDLVNYLRSGCKPKDKWRIGTEHEKFGFDQKTLQPMTYEQIATLLEHIADRFSWDKIMEGDRIIGLRSNGQSVTLEPGGQFELSGAPLETVHQTCAEVNGHLYQVKSICEEEHVGFLGLGFNPKHTLEEIPIMPKGRYTKMRNYMPKVGSLGLEMMFPLPYLPTLQLPVFIAPSHSTHSCLSPPLQGRYTIMRNYMPKVGSLGLEMMFRTCTVQVNLDFDSEQDMVDKFRVGLALQPVNLDFDSEQDMVDKFRVGLALQPVATALFANSPFLEGKPNGYLSYRSRVWEDTDKDRTGDLPFVFEDGFSFERYVEYALDVPMYFAYRDQRYIDATGLSFRDFLNGKLPVLPGAYPTLNDWENHLTTIFPEVRLKRYLEMRGADGGSWRRICALPAFWVLCSALHCLSLLLCDEISVLMYEVTASTCALPALPVPRPLPYPSPLPSLPSSPHPLSLCVSSQVGLLYDRQALDECKAIISDWTELERSALRTHVPDTLSLCSPLFFLIPSPRLSPPLVNFLLCLVSLSPHIRKSQPLPPSALSIVLPSLSSPSAVPRMALKTPFREGLLQHLAQDLVRISRDGLQRRGYREGNFLKELENIAATGVTPAERMLEAYHGRWGESVDPIYKELIY